MIEDRYRHFLTITDDATAAAILAVGELLAGQAEPLTVAAAAKVIGVSVGAVYQLCREGKLKHQRIGRAVRIRPEDARAYSERQTGGPPGRLRCLKTVG
jgi:excisionase family DNA binding protein